MSLPTNNKNKGKQGKNNPKNNNQGSKFILKTGKGPSVTPKTHKTGGTREAKPSPNFQIFLGFNRKDARSQGYAKNFLTNPCVFVPWRLIFLFPFFMLPKLAFSFFNPCIII